MRRSHNSQLLICSNGFFPPFFSKKKTLYSSNKLLIQAQLH